MFALSEPGKLDAVLAAAGLIPQHDNEVDCRIFFEDAKAAVRAFVGAGPTALAIQQSGEEAVADSVRRALGPFTASEGNVTLPAWFRAVITQA